MENAVEKVVEKAVEKAVEKVGVQEDFVSICVRVPRSHVEKINAKLAGEFHPKEQDPVTRIITVRPVYPNGIADWVQQLVGNHIGQAIGIDDDEVKAAQAEIAAIQQRCQKMYHPTVTVE